MRPVPFSLIAALAISNASCNGNAVLTPQPAEPEKQIDSPFAKDLLKAAAEYELWGRVDNETRVAPMACSAPGPQPNPPQPHFSASKDETTHGRKLYFLFSKNRNDYLAIAKNKAAAVGQVIVKQSWIPEEVTDPKSGFKVLKAGKQGDLFVMMKLDPKTPGTDEGWVYATLSSDGKKLTSAGKIESCMKCHQETKTDRLFGLQLAKESK